MTLMSTPRQDARAGAVHHGGRVRDGGAVRGGPICRRGAGLVITDKYTRVKGIDNLISRFDPGYIFPPSSILQQWTFILGGYISYTGAGMVPSGYQWCLRRSLGYSLAISFPPPFIPSHSTTAALVCSTCDLSMNQWLSEKKRQAGPEVGPTSSLF